MLDSAGSPPDLSLFIGARDEVMFVCTSSHAGSSWRGKGGLIYVVVHRSHGAWTHVYRVVRDKQPGRLAVFVEKVIEGEQAQAACAWARVSFAQDPEPSGVPAPSGAPAPSGVENRRVQGAPAAELQRFRA